MNAQEKKKPDPSAAENAVTRSEPLQTALILAGLAGFLTFLFYLPLLGNHFVNWDDPDVISNNVHIRSLDFTSFRWMFTSFYQGFWTPLTWFSLALDYHWGGPGAGVFHFHNLILHILNTSLVFLLSLRIFNLSWGKRSPEEIGKKTDGTIPAAFGAALLFGLHPIQVETVAWATSRKDLLCGFFYIASILFYLDYIRRPGPKAWKYYACLVLFGLALLSKPMAVSLPLVLLLLDGWPLKRFWNERSMVLMEKIPFFVLAFLAGVFAVQAESRLGALPDLGKVPLDLRVMNAFHSLVLYLWKIILPLNLGVYYPILTGKGAFTMENLASFLLVALMAGACFYYWRKRPYLAAGGLFYLVTLTPVLGIMQIGFQAAANRYAYLPSLGPFMLLASVAVNLLSSRPGLLKTLAVVLTLALGMATVHQVGIWKDSVSLWENSINNVPCALAYSALGDAYSEEGRKDDAVLAFDQAIALDGNYAKPHDGKGVAFLKARQWDQAIPEFYAAIALNPQDFMAHSNLGMIYALKGMTEEALRETLESIRCNPDYFISYFNLGRIYLSMGKYKESIDAYQQALSLEPGNPMCISDLYAATQKAAASLQTKTANP